jgi:hypothetical protein
MRQYAMGLLSPRIEASSSMVSNCLGEDSTRRKASCGKATWSAGLASVDKDKTHLPKSREARQSLIRVFAGQGHRLGDLARGSLINPQVGRPSAHYFSVLHAIVLHFHGLENREASPPLETTPLLRQVLRAPATGRARNGATDVLKHRSPDNRG